MFGPMWLAIELSINLTIPKAEIGAQINNPTARLKERPRELRRQAVRQREEKILRTGCEKRTECWLAENKLGEAARTGKPRQHAAKRFAEMLA